MKIAQVISTGPFAWATGGPARGVYELSKELVRRGHEITILTTNLNQYKQRYMSTKTPEYINGIRIIRFRNINNWLACKYHISIAPGIANYLKNNITEYDIIHLQDMLSYHAIATSIYCHKIIKPYVFTPHGSITWLTQNKPINWLYTTLWGRGIIVGASKIICLTETELDQCKSIGINGEKLALIPNGINLTEFETLPSRGDFRGKWNIRPDQKIILFLARIHKIKGPDILAKAFTKISKEIDCIKLVFAGPDDGYLHFLKRLVRELGIEKKVLFTGPLYDREKLQAYIDADVYVLPSRYETFPISIIEACACETPVIVTDRCRIAKMIDGQVGLVVPFEENALAHAILDILNDVDKRQKYSKNGKSIIHEELNWAKITTQIECIYRETITSCY